MVFKITCYFTQKAENEDFWHRDAHPVPKWKLHRQLKFTTAVGSCFIFFQNLYMPLIFRQNLYLSVTLCQNIYMSAIFCRGKRPPVHYLWPKRWQWGDLGLLEFDLQGTWKIWLWWCIHYMKTYVDILTLYEEEKTWTISSDSNRTIWLTRKAAGSWLTDRTRLPDRVYQWWVRRS